MDFSKLKHRIIFLRPTDITQNSMGETVPRYKAFKPHIKLPFTVRQDDVYLSHNEDGNAVLVESSGRVYAHKLSIREFSVESPTAALARESQDMDNGDSYMVYSCVTEPCLKSRELQNAFGCVDPMEIVDKIFEPGEIPQIALECLKLAGYVDGVKAIDDIKNS